VPVRLPGRCGNIVRRVIRRLGEHVFVRDRGEVNQVRQLHASGISTAAIARATGIPRSTVRGWLTSPDYIPGARSRLRAAPREPEHAVVAQPAYAYLLGLYLGDGHVAQTGGRFRLEIKLDALYPGIVTLAADAIRAVLPGRTVATRRHRVQRCVAVSAYSALWPALLPQHGAGRKHLRPIRLREWQQEITTREPEALVRGLIHSDGCRYTAVVRRRGREYRYVRYAFANRSDDIKTIFCAHLDLLGVRWTRPNDKDIAVARKADVALMDRFVGPKR